MAAWGLSPAHFVNYLQNHDQLAKVFPDGRTVHVPTDGKYGSYYCQAVNSTAPNPWAARLWQEFLFSDQGQILWLKGFAHPARFNDLAKRKKIPKSLLDALPPLALYAKAKFASVAQQTVAKNKIAAEWPSKVGA